MDLRNSGFEKVMGGSLRICKERIHTWLHDGLRTWVAAGVDDEWAVETVRFGPVSTSSSRDYHQPGGGGAIGLVPKSPERSVGQQTPQQLQQSPGKRRSKRPDLDMAFGEKGLEEELQLPKLDLDLGSQSAWAF